MALTPNLQLHYYGGDIAGSITDNGSQHTGADRLFLDKFLTTLAQSDRHYIPPATSVDATFGLDLNATGGTLPNGGVFYYKIGVVGTDGFERSASGEQSITTPDTLSGPAAPGIRDAADGTLAAGLYYYAMTAKSDIQESILGPAATVNVAVGINQALNIDAPNDSQGVPLQVWRKKDTDVGYTRLGVIAAGETFLDDGSIPAERYALDPAYAPPQFTVGSAKNSVQVTLVGDAADAAENNTIKAWRIYRSTVSGYYSAQSLVHEVVEKDTTDGSEDGPLRTTWVDTGDALAAGQPQISDRSVTLTPYAPEVATALPANTAGFPDGYLVIVDGVLYLLTDSVWQPVGSASNSVTYGSSVPATTGRRSGDMHLLTTTGAFYGLTGGSWALIYSPPAPRPALLSGARAPGTSDGLDNDFWLDTSATPPALYGPKATTWGDPIKLAGAGGGSSPLLTSPNGTVYRQTATDDGQLVLVETDEPGPSAQPQNITVEDVD